MKVVINGSEKEVAHNTKLRSAVDVLIRSHFGYAVAVNSRVVPQSEWEQYELKDGDEILLIQATQGG